MENDRDTDRAARLAALQARRSTAATRNTATMSVTTGRTRRHHPARGSRIAATVMSAAAMVGITGYMASSDQTTAAGPAATVATAQETSAAASLTAATSAVATQAGGAVTTATQATTVSQGS